MPTHRPVTTHKGVYPLSKPWHARAKREGLEWSLGYFATKEEAIAAEEHFNNEVIPRKVNQYA